MEGRVKGTDICQRTLKLLSVLEVMKRTPDKETRMIIASNPAISTAILRKLSRSTYPPLKELATQKLEERLNL